MVDVSAKPVVLREAIARGEIRLAPATLKLIESNAIAKGNVLATARLAGIQAAKKTGELIPLCHPLLVGSVYINFEIGDDCVLHPRVTLYADTRLGARVTLHSGAVVGADGFDFIADLGAQMPMRIIGALLGIPDITIDEAQERLRRIGLTSEQEGETLRVTIPGFRPDLTTCSDHLSHFMDGGADVHPEPFRTRRYVGAQPLEHGQSVMQ